MNLWNDIWADVISGTIKGIGGWIAGMVKGEKKSISAIERKETLYQPLINELEPYSKFGGDILTEIDVPLLCDICSNAYKYGLNRELQSKCEALNDAIFEYITIDPVSVADRIIVQIFEEAYEKLYGSIIEAVCSRGDEDGHEWEEEILAKPVEAMEQSDFSEVIKCLLLNRERYNDEVCIDEEKSIYAPICKELKDIYASVLYLRENGKQYNLPECKIRLTMLPEEYIAYHYDFFERFYQDEAIKNKKEIKEEITYSAQAIVQDLKDRIQKIVENYEAEQI